LLDAQKVECAAVHSAVVAKESAQAKLDAVIARHQVAIDETNHALGMAQAHLVSVSGIERAALLVDQPIANLRAAARANPA